MRLTRVQRASGPARVRCALRLGRFMVFCAVALLAADCARAEYIVLRSGQRLNVNAYQLVGDTYHLQLAGGFVDVPAADVVSIEPEEIFTPSAPVPRQTAPEPFRELIRAAAAKYSVDADLIASVIAAESNFDPKAISRRNARGLMQLLPATAMRLGVRDIFDPQENIEAGTRYLAELLARYRNDLALTLAAYNAGPERVQQYGAVPPYAETLSYVRAVKKTYARRKSVASAQHTRMPASANSASANLSSTITSSAPNSYPASSSNSYFAAKPAPSAVFSNPTAPSASSSPVSSASSPKSAAGPS